MEVRKIGSEEARKRIRAFHFEIQAPPIDAAAARA